MRRARSAFWSGALCAVGLASCVPSELSYEAAREKDTGHSDSSGSGSASGASQGGRGAGGGTSAGGGVAAGGDLHDAGSGGRLGDARSEDAPVEVGLDVQETAPPTTCLDMRGGPRQVEVIATRGGALPDSSSALHYCMDVSEVRNADYQEFLFSIRNSPPQQPQECDWNKDFEPFDQVLDGSVDIGPLNEPVTGVDWCDAYVYCGWAGKHLCGKVGGGPVPYDAFASDDSSEWQNACSNDGQTPYPYDVTYDASACVGANNSPGIRDVGSSKKCRNENGIFDLSGNVWEWEDSCATTTGSFDECRARGGDFESPENLLACGADSAQFRVLRRSSQDYAVGFRCCASTLLPP